MRGREEERGVGGGSTDAGGLLALQHHHALDQRGAGIVDASQHRLGVSVWASRSAGEQREERADLQLDHAQDA